MNFKFFQFNKKKLYLFIIFLFISISMFYALLDSKVYAAEPITLDITHGNIVITSTGYSVNGSTETPYTGDYIISGNKPGNTVDIKSGTHNITTNSTAFERIPFSLYSNVHVTLSGRGNGYSFTAVEDATNVKITLNNYSCDGGDDYYGVNPIELSSGSSVTVTLQGNNTLIASYECSAIRVPENSSLTIDGTGTLTANYNKGYNGAVSAVIGGQYNSNFGSITINGGTLNIANNSISASIGSGNRYNTTMPTQTGSIAINNGLINVTSIGNINNTGATLTGSGQALININDTNNIKADTTDFNALVKSSNTYSVYGDAILADDLTLAGSETLNIPSGTRLIIPDNITLTNNGTVTNSGELVIIGSIDGSQSIPGSIHSDHTGGTATCTTKAICSYCKFPYGSVDSNNHKKGPYVDDNNTTCINDGTKTAVCQYGCGKKYDSITIPATGHSMSAEWTITKKPTYTEKGNRQRTCSICGYIEAEELPMLVAPASDTTAKQETTTSKKKETTKSSDVKLYKSTPNTNDVYNPILWITSLVTTGIALILILHISIKQKTTK